jgi:hypothetical protein
VSPRDVLEAAPAHGLCSTPDVWIVSLAYSAWRSSTTRAVRLTWEKSKLELATGTSDVSVSVLVSRFSRTPRRHVEGNSQGSPVAPQEGELVSEG